MRMAAPITINHLDAASTSSFHHHPLLLNDPHLLLRKPCRRCLFSLSILLLYFIAAAYLLWPSPPALSIINLRLHGIRTHPQFIIHLTVRVWNPDLYSIDYDSFIAAVGYTKTGERLGFVTFDGGRIERLEPSYFNASLDLNRLEILSDVITLDVETEITGMLGILVFDLPLKTKMQCALTVDVYNQKIHRQSCYSERINLGIDEHRTPTGNS